MLRLHSISRRSSGRPATRLRLPRNRSREESLRRAVDEVDHLPGQTDRSVCPCPVEDAGRNGSPILQMPRKCAHPNWAELASMWRSGSRPGTRRTVSDAGGLRGQPPPVPAGYRDLDLGGGRPPCSHAPWTLKTTRLHKERRRRSPLNLLSWRAVLDRLLRGLVYLFGGEKDRCLEAKRPT